MRGTIIKRGDSYRIRVSLGKDPDTGKYTSYFETFRGDKPEADKRLREILTALDRGVFVKPVKDTLAEYLKSWLRDYCRPNLSFRTHELYSHICNKHIIPKLGKKRLIDVRPQHLQQLYAEKLESGLSNRTVQ